MLAYKYAYLYSVLINYECRIKFLSIFSSDILGFSDRRYGLADGRSFLLSDSVKTHVLLIRLFNLLVCCEMMD